MKIDLLISSLTGGGAERVVSVLANHFCELGHQVRIITFVDTEDAYELNPNIERIVYKKKFLLFNIVTFKCLLFLLNFYRKKSNRPDIICSHISLLGYGTIPVAWFYKIKITVTEHINHKIGQDKFSKKFLRKVLYPRADAVTVLTHFDLDYYRQYNKNTRVVYNPSSYKANFDISGPREKVILTVGNLNRYHQKGYDNLIDIVKDVLPKYPEWKLKIVGSGDQGMNLINKKVKEFGLSDQVVFTGFRTDVKELMQTSEIFILPSRFEGLPMVLIEAMSQGMACISYDCISGPSDIIDSEINGTLVTDQNMEEMALKLEELILDNDLRLKYRKNVDKVLDKFEIGNVGKQWTNLFEDLLQKKVTS